MSLQSGIKNAMCSRSFDASVKVIRLAGMFIVPASNG